MKIIIEHDGSDIAYPECNGATTLATLHYIILTIADLYDCPLSDLNIRFVDE